MLKLYVRDNNNGHVHEYGTSPHDALALQADGSLHYENLQSCTGTMFPDEGYSFCLVGGTVPSLSDPEQEPYVDIGGEYDPKDEPKTYTIEEIAKKICNSYDECAEDECPGFYDCRHGKIGTLTWLEKFVGCKN